MIKEKLKQIDSGLIELLGKRIAVLAESELPCLDEPLDKIIPLLAQAGVPEFVWKNVVISCAAAVANHSSSSTNTQPRKVTIIGGRGIMGRFFTSRFSAAGHKVNILEHDDWNRADKLLADVDLVLVCVPIEHTLDVIQKAALYLEPTTALADITSIKTPVVQAMLEHHTGPVLSLHPMFGSSIKSFLSQNVIVCPGRQFEAFQWLLEMIKGEGGKVIVCTPSEHDQMMVVIQAVRHFCAFSLGVFLAEEGIDISRSLEFSSPPYRIELDMVSRLFNQDASLHMNLISGSEERRQAISRLANTYSHLAHLVMHKDQAGLKREFEKAHSVFRPEAGRAVKESDRIIDYLSILLAASEVEQI
ncbi:MAG: bifunctional chorismate mutase/prephenate dehydrogenase [Brasilonema angustatum HA4187-MV1]|jgi:prephenate dehydrogenase/chorismate mutase/prephenate dehydrogenase|nr:bifunctional chorismate mutase/prephenate dehydrogenase [Brasilonema angustatum HA4187-MV1]